MSLLRPDETLIHEFMVGGFHVVVFKDEFSDLPSLSPLTISKYDKRGRLPGLHDELITIYRENGNHRVIKKIENKPPASIGHQYRSRFIRQDIRGKLWTCPIILVNAEHGKLIHKVPPLKAEAYLWFRREKGLMSTTLNPRMGQIITLHNHFVSGHTAAFRANTTPTMEGYGYPTAKLAQIDASKALSRLPPRT